MSRYGRTSESQPSRVVCSGLPKRKRDGFLDLNARFPTLRVVGGYATSICCGDAVVMADSRWEKPSEVTL